MIYLAQVTHELLEEMLATLVPSDTKGQATFFGRTIANVLLRSSFHVNSWCCDASSGRPWRREDEEQRYVGLCISKVVVMALAARWSESHDGYVRCRDMWPKWRPLQSP